jgi:hypothetical protein
LNFVKLFLRINFLSSDYSCEPEPNGNRINIGRYGNTAEASMSFSDQRGDLNNDEKVNIQDIQLCVNVILGAETNPGIVARADVNEDGGG